MASGPSLKAALLIALVLVSLLVKSGTLLRLQARGPGSLAPSHGASTVLQPRAHEGPQVQAASDAHGTAASAARKRSKRQGLKLDDLPFWDVTDPGNKIHGVSLGNWFVLERWMNEDWFVAHAPGAVDEWTFIETMGRDRAMEVLEAHWASWVGEADLDLMQAYAINHVRIPLPFWTLVPTKKDEPYINTTQLAHLKRMLGWLHERGMRALIDLHAMPGGQNGDQACGHAGQLDWFTGSNQRRSVDVIRSLIDWLALSGHKSVVSGVAPVNEPVGVLRQSKSHWSRTRKFYEKVYPILKEAGYPMYFHHAFAPNPVEFWRDFAADKDPRFLVLTDNPYPGNFPPQTNEQKIIAAVCSNMNSYASFPVPSVKTEWSLASGIQDTRWDAEYFATQASAYGWSAGSFFWSWRVEKSSLTMAQGRAADVSNYGLMQFSLSWLLKQPGIIPRKASPRQSAKGYLEALPDPQCGPMRDLTYPSRRAVKDTDTNSTSLTHTHSLTRHKHTKHREAALI